jgi:two-component system, chemotaxis family, sensor kinase CheA
MEEFKDKFISDALDLLNSIEETALELEKKPRSKELINTLFRAFHTLKGSAAMYDFKYIEKLMHSAENVYEQIRNGKKTAKKEIINLSLQIVDFTKKILSAKQGEKSELLQDGHGIYESIKKYTDTDPEGDCDGNGKDTTLKTIHIRFKETEAMTERGIKAKTLMKQLGELGQLVPLSVKKADAEYWDFFIVTKRPLCEAEDVFVFLQEFTEAQLLAETNLFDFEHFSVYVQTCASMGQNVDMKKIRQIADELKPEGNDDEILSEAFDKNGDRENKTVFLKVSADKIDEQMNLLSELVTSKEELRLATTMKDYEKLNKIVEAVDKITNRFRKNILQIRLIPIKALYLRFSRLVRDISEQLGKEINFEAEGLETELDKNIIDSLEGPLTHLIRNCIDHGIESPEERKKQGKDPKGNIFFKAYRSASEIFIEINDDGKGIDQEKIRQKAEKMKLIGKDEKLTDQKLTDLIFMPGISTAQNISEVSGRGVGMDAVKRDIGNLRGEIDVESKTGKGTSFIIKLPLTLSIVDTMLTQADDQFMAIPLQDISHCTQVRHEQIVTSNNMQLEIEGELLPCVYLRDIFNIQTEAPEKERIVIVKHNNINVGIIVDKVIGEHQAVIKPLGDFFINQEYFSGASLLADGHLSVILDTGKLIKENAVLQKQSKVMEKNAK